jgi:4'-phosphopantetheinyl transferase
MAVCVVHAIEPEWVFERLRCEDVAGWLAPARSAGEFARASDFREHTAGRLLARCALSEALGIDPWQVVITAGLHGKPLALDADGKERVHFSLSGSDDIVVCATCPNFEVGVDVERADRVVDAVTVATAFFHADEAARITSAGLAASRLFLQYWTLKEAFVKARGEGLTKPLDRFSLELDGDLPYVAWTSPELGERPQDWLLRHVIPSSQHVIGVALRSGGEDVELRLESGHALLERCLERWR